MDKNLINKSFGFLSAFYMMPVKESTRMKNVIWAENWKKITPLLQSEISQIDFQRQAYEKAYKPSLRAWTKRRTLGGDYLPFGYMLTSS